MNKQQTIDAIESSFLMHAAGLTSAAELQAELDAVNVRGAMRDDLSGFIGYDYNNQQWIEI